jgi:hypothetical protein
MSPVQEAEARLREAERQRDVARKMAAEAMSLLSDAQLLELRRTLAGAPASVLAAAS